MKQFNPTQFQLDMPVQYIAENDENKLVLTGHYAYRDLDGYHYVWRDGGTSYTRAFNMEEKPYNPDIVIRCSIVFPMDSTCHSEIKHNMAVKINEDMKTFFNKNVNEHLEKITIM